jgi:hypothetical protein
MKRSYPLFFLFLLAAGLGAQTPVDSAYRLHLRKAAAPIRLDGVLDEPAWQSAEVARNFRLNFPVDTGFATARTEVRVTFDDRNLYIAAVCYQRRDQYTVQSLKRDFPNGTSDVFNILLDPFKDGLNGFLFGLNPLGTQREALIDNGINLSFEWDNKWNSVVENHDDRWVAEVAIPFKTLRYKVTEGGNTWRINFARGRLIDTDISTWRPVPQPFVPNNLAFAGELVWLDAPPRPGANVALLPYTIGRYDVDYQRDASTQELISRPREWKWNAGGDAKIGITPSLNLDLTINPDFSQVEVDRQVANLSRFELFFPERRQFFLENRDLFAMFGFPNTRPFFSRRIGLAYNRVQQRNETVPILAGARLSGKLNDDWRIGLLSMQTRQLEWDSASALPAANYTVATAQRKVFDRSAVSAILVSKQNFLGALNDEQRNGLEAWNRVAGLEYNLYSKDNRWEGEWYYHRSFSSLDNRDGQTLAHFLSFTERHWQVRTGYQHIDANYDAPVGFVPRRGIHSFFPGASYTFYYPNHPRLNTVRINATADITLDLNGRETDRDAGLGVELALKDQTFIFLGVFNAYTYLFFDFDPTNLYAPGTLPLPGGRGYPYSNVRGYIQSSTVHDLQFTVDWSAGEFFNGTLVSAGGELSYRVQPYGSLGLGYSYNRIRLPAPHASADFWLLGPRAELAFSRSFFASAFFQYNTQTNNFNINTRLQWRFAPVSDLFLVYTDNSFAEPIEQTVARFFTPKNRALVLKVVYWLNA